MVKKVTFNNEVQIKYFNKDDSYINSSKKSDIFSILYNNIHIILIILSIILYISSL